MVALRPNGVRRTAVPTAAAAPPKTRAVIPANSDWFQASPIASAAHPTPAIAGEIGFSHLEIAVGAISKPSASI